MKKIKLGAKTFLEEQPMKQDRVTRRRFVRTTVLAATAALGLPPVSIPAAVSAEERVTGTHLPRWRGFNLTDKFNAGHNSRFRESDFEWIAGWGFNFVRLPMSYLCWTPTEDWTKLEESVLKEIDQAVEFGRKFKVHVNLNLHRAPGYCVNPPKEPLDLWTDDKALEACAFHWAQFARRYQGVPSTVLSFDLLNEPPDIAEETYVRVVKRLVEAIRAVDADRLIIADGLRWGMSPVFGLAGLGIGQSTRGYEPTRISHYKATWMRGSGEWPEPAWPLKIKDNDVWDKERLRRERIEPWRELERKGVGVHVGECGAFLHTPHPVVLAWMRSYLELWKEAGWGYALWNFRGPFGILDSSRMDVKYEDYREHKLDRRYLELLQSF